VLLEDGQLVAFGSNDVGQLGIRTSESTVAMPRPVALPTGVRIAHIACGSRHSAAVSIDGRVYVWGGGVEDVLGFPQVSASVAIPTLVSALTSVVIVTVACGGAHTLFVSATGAVFAAGSNTYAQCGVDECASTAIVRLPRALFDGEAVHHVAAGVQHSAALTVAGSVYCWGDDSERQCAGAVTGLCRRPRAVFVPNAGTPVVSVACGRSHTAALDAHGRLWTWGDNRLHQLGRQYTHNVDPIVGIATGGDVGLQDQTVRSALIASNHTVLLTWEGDVVRFGIGSHNVYWNMGMPNPFANTYGFVAFGAVVDSAPPYWLTPRTLPLNCMPRDRVVNILESVALLRKEARTAARMDDRDSAIDSYVALARLCARSGIAALLPLAASAIDAAALATETNVHLKRLRTLEPGVDDAGVHDDEMRESDVAALARLQLAAALLSLRRGDTYYAIVQLRTVANLLPPDQVLRRADREHDETLMSVNRAQAPSYRSLAPPPYQQTPVKVPPAVNGSAATNRPMPLAVTTGLARYFLARAAWRAGEWDAASQRLGEALATRPGELRTRGALYTILRAKECDRQHADAQRGHDSELDLTNMDESVVDPDDETAYAYNAAPEANDQERDRDDDDRAADDNGKAKAPPPPAAETGDELFSAYASAYAYELAFPQTPRPRELVDATSGDFDPLASLAELCSGDLLHADLVVTEQ
jgi:hypothetical protein